MTLRDEIPLNVQIPLILEVILQRALDTGLHNECASAIVDVAARVLGTMKREEIDGALARVRRIAYETRDKLDAIGREVH